MIWVTIDFSTKTTGAERQWNSIFLKYITERQNDSSIPSHINDYIRNVLNFQIRVE